VIKPPVTATTEVAGSCPFGSMSRRVFLSRRLPRLVLHEVLVEVDAEQRADELAGGHPPREEGEQTPQEERREDGAQRGEGLRQARHGGLDVLLRVLHPLLVFVETAGQHGRHGGQHQRRRHPGGLLHPGDPGEVPYEADGEQAAVRFGEKKERKSVAERNHFL